MAEASPEAQRIVDTPFGVQAIAEAPVEAAEPEVNVAQVALEVAEKATQLAEEADGRAVAAERALDDQAELAGALDALQWAETAEDVYATIESLHAVAPDQIGPMLEAAEAWSPEAVQAFQWQQYQEAQQRQVLADVAALVRPLHELQERLTADAKASANAYQQVNREFGDLDRLAPTMQAVAENVQVPADMSWEDRMRFFRNAASLVETEAADEQMRQNILNAGNVRPTNEKPVTIDSLLARPATDDEIRQSIAGPSSAKEAFGDWRQDALEQRVAREKALRAVDEKFKRSQRAQATREVQEKMRRSQARESLPHHGYEGLRRPLRGQ